MVLELQQGLPSGTCSFAAVVELGSEHYGRLTVPPGVWMAFHGLGSELNLVFNLASIEHDPEEALTAPLERFPFGSPA